MISFHKDTLKFLEIMAQYRDALVEAPTKIKDLATFRIIYDLDKSIPSTEEKRSALMQIRDYFQEQYGLTFALDETASIVAFDVLDNDKYLLFNLKYPKQELTYLGNNYE